MRAIFLDRDGVICENRVNHVVSWDTFHFLPHALDALRWLRATGLRVFVVTNQAIVSRGLASAATVEEINARMAAVVASHGGRIDAIRYCPHDNHEHCHCRKPQPGMLLDLAAEWQIDLAHSYMVGDAWTDVAAGHAANCRTSIVRTGRGEEQLGKYAERHSTADYIAADLLDAVNWILYTEGKTSHSWRPRAAPGSFDWRASEPV